MSLCVTQVYAARGTMVAMVGMRASCQPAQFEALNPKPSARLPIPVLMMVAPASSTALASVTI
jgi:hypothetical protein